VTTPANVLSTSIGDYPLGECRVAVGGREWAVLYTVAVVTRAEESRYLSRSADDLPYGVALWPGAIALSHEIALRAAEFRGKRVMELGAGTGLPGIVAASAGAAVVQSDWSELALHVCKLNGERNGARGIEYREVDWAAWADPAGYDWLIGSDILYSHSNHEHLRRIFEVNLAPGGRVLLADPYRGESLLLLEEMASAGWRVTHSRWSIGEGVDARPVAVYELTPPGSAP
jgi:predicted nicotinamide N-methyase